MSQPWFRMYHEFYTDPVVQCLAFEDQRHFVVVLCMKCDGLLDRKITTTNRDRLIYRALGLDPNSAEEAKRRLMEVNLIDKNWQPLNWDKRQFISDNSTERWHKHLNKKKSTNVGQTLDKRPTNVGANGPDTDTDTDTDTEKDSSRDKSLLAGTKNSGLNGHEKIPYQEIVGLYHEILPMLPKVMDLTDARKAQIRSRWQNKNHLPDIQTWREYFEHVSKSPLLVGQVDPAPGHARWRADLEWLTKQSNFVKVWENRYHG